MRGSTTAAEGIAAGDLLSLLRRETSALHEHVEEVTDLPGAVRSHSDYVALLQRFWVVHRPLEQQLGAVRWEKSWARIGIDLAQHRRTHLIARDLRELAPGRPSTDSSRPSRAAAPHVGTFGQALGCLYVLEGSSLGGRVLAQQVTAALGGVVPVAFLSSDGRGHPGPWRTVCEGLRRFGSDGIDAGDVVTGARETFHLFARSMQGHTEQRVLGPTA